MRDETKEKFIRAKEFVENAIKFWVTEIKNEKNIKDGVNPNFPLTKTQALLEAWVSRAYFWTMTRKYPELEKVSNKIEETTRKKQQRLADSIITKALDVEKWGMQMKDVDRAKFALDLQKSTNVEFNPTKNVSLEIEDGLDFSNLSELKKQLMDELNIKDGDE